MHIENVHIHLGEAGLTAPELAKALGFGAAASLSQAATAIPSIGALWPGIQGVYVGISRGENGEPDAHLVLLDAKPDRDMAWGDAVKWAEGLGEGARLPTRFESAMLYANLQDRFDTDRWHWTGTQYSSGYAWAQSFGYGYQNGLGKYGNECRARAVRRLIL